MFRLTKAVIILTLGLLAIGAYLAVTAEDKGATEKKSPSEKSSEAVQKKKVIPLQSTCPIMGGTINKKLYFDYEGKRIYVCCEGCIDAVKKDPEAAIKKIESMGHAVEVIAVKEPGGEKKELALQTTCPVMTKNPINRSLYVDYNGKRIYVCCGACISKVKENPEKYIEVLREMGQQPEAVPAKSAKKAM